MPSPTRKACTCKVAAYGFLGATQTAPGRYPIDMSPFTYRCPKTGFRVQSHSPTKTSDGAYEVVECVICGRVHLVNPVSGRVLGENKEKPAKVLQTAAL